MLPTEPNTPPNSRVWRIIHFPLVSLVVAFGIMMLGAVALNVLALAFGGLPDRFGVDLTGRILATVLTVLSYLVFVRFVERHRTIPDFGTKGWARELGTGWVAGFILFTVVIAVIALLGGYHVIGTNPATVLLVPIIVTTCTGFTEEILFRGIIFRLTERLLGSWLALLLSAALFGAAHLSNPNATGLAAIAIALEAGVMLGAVYMVTRRLWAAIGLHAAWNFAQGAVYGVAVSGFEQHGLLQSRMTGPVLLTGGAFGAEASLPAIFIDTLFGIALLVVAVRRGNIVAPMWARSRRDHGAGVQL